MKIDYFVDKDHTTKNNDFYKTMAIVHEKSEMSRAHEERRGSEDARETVSHQLTYSTSRLRSPIAEGYNSKIKSVFCYKFS